MHFAGRLPDIEKEANDAADNDPVDLQTLDNFNDIYDDSAAPGYFHFLMNPSDMNEGWLRNGQYAAIGTAVVAGGAAIALKGLAVAGISQIGAVGLAQVPAQIVYEFQLLVAATGTATGLQRSIGALQTKWRDVTISVIQDRMRGIVAT